MQSCLIWQLCACVSGFGVCLCSPLLTQPVVISNQSIGTQSTAPALPSVICPLCPSIILSIYHTPPISPYPWAKIITACQHLACDKLEDLFFFLNLSSTQESWHDWHSSRVLIVVLWADFSWSHFFHFDPVARFCWQPGAEGVAADSAGSPVSAGFLLQEGEHCSASTSEGLPCSSVNAKETECLIKFIWGNFA